MNKEAERLKEVETRLTIIKNTYENLLPIWNVIDRKKQTLDLEIKLLVDERNQLIQGQIIFDETF